MTTPPLMRPLVPLAVDAQFPSPITLETVATFRQTPAYSCLQHYFESYPPRSLMGAHSRAILYTLIRALRPQVVAEVGTLYAGTTEAMARALWENGTGEIHTADPFGAERCPPIILNWPTELQAITHFHPFNSMAFFMEFQRRQMTLDLALVDGHHDYEFALFDLQMAARLLRPGGIIVMDNSDQAGPFQACRAFLAEHPAWRELGTSVADYRTSDPFDERRSSLPKTAFVILQAPEHMSLGEAPRSWGPLLPMLAPNVDGLTIELPAQRTTGTLHYRVFARGFADENRHINEQQAKGSLRLALHGAPESISHTFMKLLAVDMPAHFTDTRWFAEIDLSWQADAGCPPLSIASPPALTHGR
jgi:hypothetical protein